MINLFKKNKEPENLKQVIKELKEVKKHLKKQETDLAGLKDKSAFLIQKPGLVRYDAYAQTGGRQSFSLALLDEEKSGVVITGLFKEGETKVFAKKIIEGECTRTLSSEEKETIKLTIKDGR